MGPFENYDKLFALISQLDPDVKFGGEYWRFIFYPVHKVTSFYKQVKKNNVAINPALKEAYEKQLGLLETCTGDWLSPQYVAVTSKAHLYYLKKKWCLAYCDYHKLDFTITAEGERDALRIGWDEGC